MEAAPYIASVPGVQSAVDLIDSMFGDMLGQTGVMMPAWVAPEAVAGVLGLPGGQNALNQIQGDKAARTSFLRSQLILDGAPSKVYMGHEVPGSDVVMYDPITGEPMPSVSSSAAMERGLATEKTPVFADVQHVMQQPWAWDPKRQQAMQQKMRAAGFTDVVDMDSMMNVWQQLVTRAATTLTVSGGKKMMTPLDALAMYKKEHRKAGMVFNADGTVSKTTTSTRIEDISEADAWKQMKSSLYNLLGRDPTEQEIRDFMSRANNIASQHPTTTTTEYTTNVGSGQTTSDTTTDQGYDAATAARLAERMAKRSPDYAEYQGALYMNQLLQMVGPAV